jgi:hypothetical protein
MSHWKSRKKQLPRYQKQTAKVHTGHKCKICDSHLACYSYDFGRTWYCKDHKHLSQKS